MPFDSGFAFGQTNITVVIQHVDEKFLRVSPGDEGNLDGNGGKGGFAQWTIEGSGEIRKFKSNKTGKYLRIFKENEIDCGGSGGPWTEFKIHGEGNERKLESVKIPGSYIAFRNGKVVYGTGGKFCIFKFFKNPPFQSPYGFVKQDMEVVIKHVGEKGYLRVSPNDVGQVDGDGGIGEFARWIVEGTGDIRKFKSKKTGKYLRIFKDNEIDCGGTGGPWTEFKINGENGHEKKLESVKLPGKYIAFRNGKVVFGTGGQFCTLKFFKN